MPRRILPAANRRGMRVVCHNRCRRRSIWRYLVEESVTALLWQRLFSSFSRVSRNSSVLMVMIATRQVRLFDRDHFQSYGSRQTGIFGGSKQQFETRTCSMAGFQLFQCRGKQQ
jgi:hypothetical protein